MSNLRYKQIDGFEEEFFNLIQASISVRPERMSTSASPFMDGPITFDARFPTQNALLENTTYQYHDSNKLLHFTSLPKLFSIINDASVRMYNLHKSNDENEYKYAATILESIYRIQGQDETSIEKYLNTTKEYSFILSCTSTDGLTNREFWEKYGDNGKGVAIEFEILNELNDWRHFYCSKVHYDNLDEFELLKKNWEDIQNRNNNITYHIDLHELLSLHKSKQWSSENEIRILTSFPDVFWFDAYNSRIYHEFVPIKPDLPIKYFKLPLCDKSGMFIEKNLEKEVVDLWKKIPRIRINDIYLGPHAPVNDLYKFQTDLKQYIGSKLGCWLSKLPRYKSIVEY